MKTGEQLKEEGTSLVLANNEAWAERAMMQLKAYAAWGEFTSDDLHEGCSLGGISPAHHNGWGALFNKAAKLGLIQHVGYRKSKRPQSHGRVVAVWRKA